MREFRVKLGKITSKKPILKVIQPTHGPKNKVMKAVGSQIDRLFALMDNQGTRFAGLAMLMWADDGASIAVVHTDQRFNEVPNLLIPDFVRSRLEFDLSENLMDDRYTKKR